MSANKELSTYIRNTVSAARNLPPKTVTTVARTNLADAGPHALIANTHYSTSQGAGHITMTLPTHATSSVGDFITIVCLDNQENTKTLKLGTDGQQLSLGSIAVTTPLGAVSQPDGTNDYFLIILGNTNGDGGAGTRITCFFDGTAWTIDANVQRQGTFAVASGTGFFT